MWLFGGFIYLKAQWYMGQYSLVFAERYSIYKHKQKTSIFIKLKFFIPRLWWRAAQLVLLQKGLYFDCSYGIQNHLCK